MQTQQLIQQTESSLDIVDGRVRLVLVWPEKPWTVNQQARTTTRHGQVKWRLLTEEWAVAFAKLADSCPAMVWCDVAVTNERVNWANFPDTGACFMTAKAAIDGVVRAGVLPDDTPQFVRTISLRPPVVTGRDALVLELEGPAA